MILCIDEQLRINFSHFQGKKINFSALKKFNICKEVHTVNELNQASSLQISFNMLIMYSLDYSQKRPNFSQKPTFSLKPQCTRDLEYEVLRRKAFYTNVPSYDLYWGEESPHITFHLLVFGSDELQHEICKKFKLSAKCFFTVCDYKSFKTKSPQFLNSVPAKRLEASFLFTALRS